MAGGLAGSVSLVLKYVMMDYPEQYTYCGYANVSQNVALMLSAVVLWIAQRVVERATSIHLCIEVPGGGRFL
jgi:hypothetical protein